MPIHRLSDSRLVRRSQQGDGDAFMVLLQRYDHRLRGLAYALVTGEAAMDRVLRTAYLRAWREVVRAEIADDAGSWLYRMVYNACIDELRRERSRLDRLDATGSVPGEAAHVAAGLTSGAHAAVADVDDPLAMALAALTPEERLAVVMVDREGFTPSGAARIVGVPQDLFDERLISGRARLTAALPTIAPRRRNPPPATRRRRPRPTPAPPASAAASPAAWPPASASAPASPAASPPASASAPAAVDASPEAPAASPDALTSPKTSPAPAPASAPAGATGSPSGPAESPTPADAPMPPAVPASSPAAGGSTSSDAPESSINGDSVRVEAANSAFAASGTAAARPRLLRRS